MRRVFQWMSSLLSRCGVGDVSVVLASECCCFFEAAVSNVASRIAQTRKLDASGSSVLCLLTPLVVRSSRARQIAVFSDNIPALVAVSCSSNAQEKQKLVGEGSINTCRSTPRRYTVSFPHCPSPKKGHSSSMQVHVHVHTPRFYM